MLENQHHPRISVVIPTHNEARNLYQVLPQIPSTVSEVVLVDGHSTDNTVSVAQQLLPGIRIIHQELMHYKEAMILLKGHDLLRVEVAMILLFYVASVTTDCADW